MNIFFWGEGAQLMMLWALDSVLKGHSKARGPYGILEIKFRLAVYKVKSPHCIVTLTPVP